jgi:formylglycine-generating enzyme
LPGTGDFPVAGVDWCDAVAYCQWAGKYLCAKSVNGKRVGPVGVGDVGDYTTHQWMIACSAQTNRWPYGPTQDALKCNVGELEAGRALAVGSMATCEGAYPGVFDLVGNVWEWSDGPCRSDAGTGPDAGDAAPQSDECFLKGGGYNRAGDNIDCRVDGLGSPRDTRAAYIGFRCCSD